MTTTTHPPHRLATADVLELADTWGQYLAKCLDDGGTLWVWGDLDHHDVAYDLVDGLIERGAIGRVRRLRLDAPLSAAQTSAVAKGDVVIVFAGTSTPRSALLVLRRSRAEVWAVTTADADWTTYVDAVLGASPDDVRRATSRIILAYARTVRAQHPDAPPVIPFAAAYPREVTK